MNFRKDRSLDELAESGNVAQFVSFAPNDGEQPVQTYSRVWSYPPNHCFRSTHEAVSALLGASVDRSVNIRSFTPESPRSRQFLYGLTDIEQILGHLNRLSMEGLHVIANETVDITDGGVSGVAEGGVIEFAPDDTPRCVEKPGTVSARRDDGYTILRTVYGVAPTFDSNDHRIEFSIHPKPRGYKRTHVLLWEREGVETREQKPTLYWPNRFSRLVGDKVFGLLVACMIGVPVPRSIVFSRRIRPFTFGEDTGSLETWLRTCPVEQVPGRYTTVDRWVDPFALLATEDPSHVSISSIISQAAVPAMFSGAAITKRDGRLHVEGIKGCGDDFMLGRVSPQRLPERIVLDLEELNTTLRDRLGPVRFEWVHDGIRAWVVQLHKGGTRTTSTTIVPGDAQDWRTFRSEDGLEELRRLLDELPPSTGIVLEGEVGLTSHLADLARKSRRPTRVIRPKKASEQQLSLNLPLPP